MIEPEVAGVAFSADPESGSRHVAAIERIRVDGDRGTVELLI
jgi:phosphoenolpyruvate synthase/pyruvate phosphate dikinase